MIKVWIIACLCAGCARGSYDTSDKIVFPNLPTAAPRSENTICREESQLYIRHLNNMTLWAHKMWDATAKSTVGVLQGSNFHFGNFDECLSVSGPFRTQHCFAQIEAKVPIIHNRSDPFDLNFRPSDHVLARLFNTHDISQQARNLIQVGWCVPASCTAKDLEGSLNQYLSSMEHPFNAHNVTYSGSVQGRLCQREKEISILDAADISFCILLGILVFLVIVGSIYEVRSSKREHKSNSLLAQILCSFSARKSYEAVQRADNSNVALKVLYGIRTFAIMMIVTDHRFGTYISGPISNFDYIETEYRSLSSWYLFHGDLFVDTFFILSGILVTYGLLKQYKKKIVHPGLIILLRYIRLTPVYAFVVFFWSTMFKHIGSGPFWNFVVPKEVQDCRKYWWSNLLYISNYVGGSEMCMIHSWYLPCDFHYFIAAIFVVRLWHNHKKAGTILMSLLGLISVLVPFVITMMYLRPGLLHFYPAVFLVDPKNNLDFQLTYIKTHTRAATYIVGMFAGYVLFKLKDKEFKISRIQSHLLTLVSVVCLFAGMASGAIFYNPYHQYNAIEAAFYAALHRTVWACGTVGLIFAASYGHGRKLYDVLSWSPCVVLGNLVYGVYLVHMMFQLRAVGMASAPRHFNYFTTFSYAISDIVLSFMLSFLLFIAIENPFRKIIKIVLFPGSGSKTHNTKESIEVPSHFNNVSTSRL